VNMTDLREIRFLAGTVAKKKKADEILCRWRSQENFISIQSSKHIRVI